MKTAYFPMYDCIVSLVHEYTNKGLKLYYVYNKKQGIGNPKIENEGNFIASENELIFFDEEGQYSPAGFEIL